MFDRKAALLVAAEPGNESDPGMCNAAEMQEPDSGVQTILLLHVAPPAGNKRTTMRRTSYLFQLFANGGNVQ
jgi:hypothetical protein